MAETDADVTAPRASDAEREDELRYMLLKLSVDDEAARLPVPDAPSDAR